MNTKSAYITIFLFAICVITPCLADECAPFCCSLGSNEIILDCNGVINGGLTFVTGVKGNAASFNGTADVNFTDNIFDVPAGSISLWFRKNSGRNCGGIWQIGSLGQKNSIGLFYDGDVNLYFEIKNSDGDFNQVSVANVLSLDNFTHIAATWEKRDDGYYIKLFINGVFEPNGWAQVGINFVHDGNLLVVSREDYHGNGEGVIDELRFFDWPLSDNA